MCMLLETVVLVNLVNARFIIAVYDSFRKKSGGDRNILIITRCLLIIHVVARFT